MLWQSDVTVQTAPKFICKPRFDQLIQRCLEDFVVIVVDKYQLESSKGFLIQVVEPNLMKPSSHNLAYF